MPVFNLYGIDKNGEPVSMFFSNDSDMFDFATEMPGNYRVMTLDGINYDSFEISSNLTLKAYMDFVAVYRLVRLSESDAS